MKSYGQTAYDAYFKYCDGKSLISGAPLPAWEDQAQNIRDAWCKAGEAVVAQSVEEKITDGVSS